MKHLTKAGIWLLLMVVTCLLLAPEAAAIKRDRPAEAKTRPELAVITARNAKTGTEGLCSGAVIAGNVVLTAGHCVQGFESWEIALPYAKNSPARSLTKRARIHPDYQPRKPDKDVALLILDNDVDIGKKFPALATGALLPLGSKLFVVGRVDNGKLARDRLFESPDVTVVADEINIDVYGGNPPVVEKGDSGGPVYTSTREPAIVAVVSGYQDVRGELVPTDIYAPLNGKNQDWIARVLREIERERAGKK